MFIVTNRQVFEDRSHLDAFGPKPNPEGPNELRLAEARKVGNSWRITILPDQVTPAMAAEVDLPLPPAPPGGEAPPVFASRYVARRLMARVNPKLVGKSGPGRDLVLFVHGYNNDMKAVLERAAAFEDNFGVEVIVFSWPANGGGVKGVISYLSDKRDARASVGAFDRVLAKMQEFLLEIHAEHETRVTALAERKYPNDAEKWDAFYTAEANKWCPFRINLVCHSMGNYLFKCLLSSSVYRATSLIFDNVVLVAADTNNEDHDDWVEKIPARKRVFITINEDDHALRASCLKMGEAQKARLGHYLFELTAKNATYVDFTGAPHVGTSHAYFEGDPLKNAQVKAFFTAAFNGEAAEEALNYRTARNTYDLVPTPPIKPKTRPAKRPRSR